MPGISSWQTCDQKCPGQFAREMPLASPSYFPIIQHYAVTPIEILLLLKDLRWEVLLTYPWSQRLVVYITMTTHRFLSTQLLLWMISKYPSKHTQRTSDMHPPPLRKSHIRHVYLRVLLANRSYKVTMPMDCAGSLEKLISDVKRPGPDRESNPVPWLLSNRPIAYRRRGTAYMWSSYVPEPERVRCAAVGRREQLDAVAESGQFDAEAREVDDVWVDAAGHEEQFGGVGCSSWRHRWKPERTDEQQQQEKMTDYPTSHRRWHFCL